MARGSWRALLVGAVLVVVAEAGSTHPSAGLHVTDVAIARSEAPATPLVSERIADPRPVATTDPRPTGRTVRASASLGPRSPGVARPTRSPASPVAARSTATATYRGRNHVWIPSLGIGRSVQSFPCSRQRPPDAGVYRWGCAGRNNIYLMSHAWSTFKPLRDAYVGGRLRKGRNVWYADGTGRVRQFSVSWWRVTAPTTTWAWAPQRKPSMTLQTCVGARSQYRLVVRLVQVA